MRVEVAGAGHGIEDGARLVVGKLLEECDGLPVFSQDAGAGVAGEVGSEACDGFGDSLLDAAGAFGIGFCEEVEAVAETGCVLLGDGEDADAALGAAEAADEMLAAACGGGDEGGVDDLEEIAVGLR